MLALLLVFVSYNLHFFYPSSIFHYYFIKRRCNPMSHSDFRTLSPKFIKMNRILSLLFMSGGRLKKGWVSYLDMGEIFSLQRYAPRGCLQLSMMMRLSYYLYFFFPDFLLFVFQLHPTCYCDHNSSDQVWILTTSCIDCLFIVSEEIGTSWRNLSYPLSKTGKTRHMSLY